MIKRRVVKEQTSAAGSQSSDPLKCGLLSIAQRQILEGLERGRRRAAERSRSIGAKNAVAVIKYANLDIQAGNPMRGRAKRIAYEIAQAEEAIAAAKGIEPKPTLTERSVKRILDRLSDCPIRREHTR